MTDFRVFFAHRKDATEAPDQTEDLEALLMPALAPAGKVPRIVSAWQDWNAHFHRHGGWEPWSRDVGAGLFYGTQEPRFHAIVVPLAPPDPDPAKGQDLTIGKATEGIVRAALIVGRKVFAYVPTRVPVVDVATGKTEMKAGVGQGKLYPVISVSRDSEDYQHGATLILAGTV